MRILDERESIPAGQIDSIAAHQRGRSVEGSAAEAAEVLSRSMAMTAARVNRAFTVAPRTMRYELPPPHSTVHVTPRSLP